MLRDTAGPKSLRFCTGLLGVLAVGMFISSTVRQLENFAGVMNFVIFPTFFLSSAVYPLWHMKESSVLLYRISAANPFTHAVELIRFALYSRLEPVALAVVLAAALVEQYRITVADATPRSLVTVQDPNGAPDKSATGEKILSLLRDQLK